MSYRCWLTGEEAKFLDGDKSTIIDSSGCGKYHLSDSVKTKYTINFEASFEPSQSKANCARKVLELSNSGIGIPYFTTKDNVQYARKYFEGLRSEHDKKIKLVLAIEDFFEEDVDHSIKPQKLLESFGERLRANNAFQHFNCNIRDMVYAKIPGVSELYEVLQYLIDLGFVKQSAPGMGQGVFDFNLMVTVNGWSALSSLKPTASSNKVFIATQFKWPENDEIRVKAIESIKNACKSLGYDADITSQDHTGNITDNIINEIKEAKFVVAELTYNNRGVYYEAGYARGMGKEVFSVVHDSSINGDRSKGQKLHFDIEQIMYRKWSNSSELEKSLRSWIQAVIGRYGD